MDRGVPIDIMDALRVAPYEPSAWTAALEAAAAYCGASSAQILAYSRKGIPMLLAPGFTDDDIAHYLELGGGDPRVNRGMEFMTGAGAVPLRPYADYEYMSEADRGRDTLYNEFFGPRDGAHMSVGVMVRKPALTANLSFMRTDPMEQGDRQATARLLPVFARTCDLQFALEGRSAAVMAQALDGLGDAMLFCDASGHLVSATRAGEAVLREGRLLTLRHGQVSCPDPVGAAVFSRLLDDCAVLRNRLSLGGAFVTRSGFGLPARIDVAPLPGERGSATLRPLAMIRIHEVRPPGRLDITHAMAAFGFTPAEAEVAEAMIGGLSSPDIARRRGVSVLTIATQTRAVLAKAGCLRRIELPARLAPFVIH